MQTIPAAMIWEMLRRSRWQLLFSLLGGIAFPTLILWALKRDGAVNPADPSMLIMNMGLMLVVGVFFAAGVFAAQARVSHLYAYPIRTSALVAWRIVPGMALLALEMLLCISVLNFLFDLHWPLWGPAIVVAVALSAAQAAAWLTEKSAAWLMTALTTVATLIGFWFRSRYGPPFSNPTHLWSNLTGGEVLVMAAAAGAAYSVAVIGVGRNRRGEAPLSVGFWAWVWSIFDNAPKRDRRFRSPVEAQLWAEWMRKGWVMPMAVLCIIAVGMIIWFFGSRADEDLFVGLFTGGYMLWFCGCVGGLVLGNIGANDATHAMGHFLATRPISDADMGRILLRNAAKSVLAAWVIWAACFALACLYIWAAGDSRAMKLPPEFHWTYFPATLLSPWVIATGLMVLGLAGRTRYLVILGLVVPTAIVLFALLAKMFLSYDVQTIVGRTLVVIVAISLIVAAVLAFVAAMRGQLIQASVVFAAAITWVAIMATGATLVLAKSPSDWLAFFLLAAFAAWVVAPFAAVPLALSWNRHR